MSSFLLWMMWVPLEVLAAALLAPRPLLAAAAVQVVVAAVAAAAAEEAEVLADGAGVGGKDASSSSHLLLLEDGSLLCSHLFQDNTQHLASYAKISGHLIFFSFYQKAPMLGYHITLWYYSSFQTGRLKAVDIFSCTSPLT